MKKITGFYHKTGAFAELAGLNPRTLHYYDQIGLFKPNRVDENGYRYYSTNQLDRLSLIITLRDLGVSLKDIRSCLESGDVEQMNLLLLRQKQSLDAMMQQLALRQQLLDHTLQSNREFFQHLNQGYLRMELPQQHWDVLLVITGDIDGQRLPPGSSVVNYLTDGPYIGMFLQHDDRGHALLFQIREDGAHCRRAGQYLCSYQTLEAGGDQIRRLRQKIRTMQDWAAAHGIVTEDCTYVEYNDNLTTGSGFEKGQYVCLRSRILSDRQQDTNGDKAAPGRQST